MNDLAVALDKLEQEHLYRLRNISSGAQQIDPIVNGQKVLSFCSNDYLGLANHPQVIDALVDGAKKYGVGAGASHLITGHHTSHHSLETELAEFIGCERALLFSTGYMANLGTVSSLANRSTHIYEDRCNHASLIDAGIISRAHVHRYKHLDTQELNEKLANTKDQGKILLSDGVFSMDGTIAPVTELQALTKNHTARLLLDDAHGIGVLGAQGKGCTEDLLTSDTILVGTLGKAFGVFGAFVAADKNTIEWIIQRARTYIYTTALPPSLAEAVRASLRIVREDSWRREKLQILVTRFKLQCEQAGIPLTNSTTPIQPIIIGAADDALKVSADLLKHGILVSAIRPPTVAKETARLRITFSAAHSEHHIDQLVASLSQVIKQNY